MGMLKSHAELHHQLFSFVNIMAFVDAKLVGVHLHLLVEGICYSIQGEGHGPLLGVIYSFLPDIAS